MERQVEAAAGGVRQVNAAAADAIDTQHRFECLAQGRRQVARGGQGQRQLVDDVERSFCLDALRNIRDDGIS